MPDGSLFTRAATWLATELRGAAAVDITYRRGPYVCPLFATPTRPTPNAYTVDDYTTPSTRRDWIITAADLVIANQVTRPADGDTLTDPDGAVWTVTRQDDSEPYRESDPAGVQLRLFTTRTQ